MDAAFDSIVLAPADCLLLGLSGESAQCVLLLARCFDVAAADPSLSAGVSCRSKDDIMAEIRQLQSEMAQYDESYEGAGTKEN